MASEVALIIIISYVKPFEIGLGTRALASPHFMVPTFSYYLIYFLWDEVRKTFVRSGTDRSTPGRIKYTNWIASSLINKYPSQTSNMLMQPLGLTLRSKRANPSQAELE